MTGRRVNSGRHYAVLGQFPAALLAHLEPGLFVDVGACWGLRTLAVLAASPTSRAIAFEPFAGNLALIGKALAGDSRVTLRSVAVGMRPGWDRFVLQSVIGDGARAGASVVGKLGFDLLHKPAAQTTVEVVTLDGEVHEHVRFLKIDVQGGERNVLRGARALMAGPGVDLIYVEFRGDWRVLNLLHARGYVILDCAYLTWPHRGWLPRRFRRTALKSEPELSNIWPSVPWRGFAAYCLWFWWQRLFRVGLQTDLMCVHQGFWPQFEAAARKAG